MNFDDNILRYIWTLMIILAISWGTNFTFKKGKKNESQNVRFENK